MGFHKLTGYVEGRGLIHSTLVRPVIWDEGGMNETPTWRFFFVLFCETALLRSMQD